MSVQEFELLDRMVEAGGQGISAKDLKATKEPAKSALEKLASDGLVDKTGGRSPKFSLNTEGEEKWKERASDNRKQEIQQRREAEQTKMLIAFLKRVESNANKLTKTEQQKFPVELRNKAVDDQLVKGDHQASEYELLPGGELLLMAQLPLDAQIKRLRHIQEDANKQWQATNKKLADELSKLGTDLAAMAGSTVDELTRRFHHAEDAFEKALDGLSAIEEFLPVAHALREAAEAKSKQSQQLTHQLDDCKKKQQDLQAGLAESYRQHQETARGLANRLDELAAQVVTVSAPKQETVAAPVTPIAPPQPSEADLWEATKKAYAEIDRRVSLSGGSVKIPELTDRVRELVNSVHVTEYHKLLRKWQRDNDWLVLKLCNDRFLEPRASEGIESERGLLFYVQLLN